MIKDIKNKRFGKLVALEMVETPKKDTRHGKWWLCQCDCGLTKKIMGVYLRNGKSKSCGCENEKTRFRRCGRTEANIIYYGYKKSANDRNLIFDLDNDTFDKLIKGNCFYCDHEPSQRLDYYKWTQGYTYNGIDRINPNIGYIPENCVSCCSKCNFAKRSMTIDNFYEWIDKLHDNLKKKGILK